MTPFVEGDEKHRVNQPQCLRFCPTLSNSNVEISNNGKSLLILTLVSQSILSRPSVVSGQRIFLYRTQIKLLIRIRALFKLTKD